MVNSPDTIVKACAVIVNWNCSADTIHAGKAIIDVGIDVIVVDNGSTDTEEVQLIKNAMPSALVEEQGVNKGYAGGVNTGMRAAERFGYTHALLFNPDTDPTRSVIDAMLGLAPFASIVGTAQVQEQGEDWIEYTSAALLDGRKPRPFSCASSCGLGHNVDIVSGAGILINLAVAKDLDYFDESYFHYKEEYDFCYRARESGVRLMYSCGPKLQHRRGGSLSGSSPSGRYYKYRNEFLFLRKTYGAFGWLSGLGLFRDAGRLAMRDPKSTGLVVKAIYHGMTGVTGPASGLALR